ncbi:MAG TPA: Glu/Leu/Phe/Val dehydrogenase dimerization domain-containing protein [Verrucomicrobiae bacterium]|nr:Glu/Leu/Phe/Val dehydrogenase dimerization domain-containing protein [Verrucomicrobiae bacterium]
MSNGSTENPEQRSTPDAVFQPYIEAGQRLDVSADVVVAALDTVNDAVAEQQFVVGDHTVTSYRYVTRPVLDTTDVARRPRPPKGGIQAGRDVTGAGIKTKAIKMGTKNLLFPVADDDMYFAGGKGGYDADSRDMSPEEYEAAVTLHALAHTYDPWVGGGVGAPDKRTGNREMDIMVRAFRQNGFSVPEACVTGASEDYGGNPVFRNPATGRGGGLILARALEVQAMDDVAMRAVMQDGGVLGGIILQGWGNAGRPFGETLRFTAPNARLKAVIEYQWAVRARDRKGFVDPAEVTDLVNQGYLTNEEGKESTLPTGSGLELVSADEAWHLPALAVVPAAGEQLVTEAVAGSWRGYGATPLIELQIANIPTTPGAAELARQAGVFTVGSDIGSAGGVTASGYGWAETMHKYGQVASAEVGWNPDGYERAWEQRISSTAAQIFKRARNEGKSPGDVMNEIIVERAVANLHRSDAI